MTLVDAKKTQKNELALAHACNLLMSDPSQHQALKARFENTTRQIDAADYFQEVENKVHARLVQGKNDAIGR